MKNSKLVSLLSKLSQKEFKEFGKFVKSPYFNSNSNIIKLYDLIAKYFPDFNNPNLTKENIYNYIYPGEKYNDSTARGLLSAALKLGEEFLAVTHLRNDEYKYKNFLLTELAHRKTFDLFNIHLKNFRNELESLSIKDEDYFLEKFKIETLLSTIESKAYIPLTQKDIPGDTHTRDSDNLITYFLITMLKRYNYLLTKTGSFNVSLDLKFFDEIFNYLSKIDLNEIPPLNYHYNRAMLYISGMNEKYFLLLKKIFYDDFENLNHSERYNLLATLQNYCVQANRDKSENTSEIQYKLYKFAIEKDILTFNEVEPIHHIFFTNIVVVALSLDKINEAKEFIQNYKSRLAPERAESVVNLNLAKVYFKEKKYDESLLSLALVHPDDVFSKASIKNLYAMIYYDKGMIEELVLLLDSYRSFLNSNIILGDKLKENHFNFVSLLTRLIKLKDVGAKSEIEYLNHEAKTMKSLLSKPWLIEKIKELLE